MKAKSSGVLSQDLNVNKKKMYVFNKQLSSTLLPLL